jgi:protease-4
MRRFRRLLVIALLIGLAAWVLLPGRGVHVEQGSILVLDLEGDFVEATEPSFWARLLGGAHRPFVGILSELAKAQRDDRLAGVVLRIRTLEVEWGMAEELRGAIEDLAAKRRTIAYLEVGSLAANREYFVATGAPEIVVAPGATSPVMGLAAEFLFLGGLWEKLGAGVETIGKGEYKSAAETLAGTKMSAAHREMATAILDSTYAAFVDGIASSRELTPDFVRGVIDSAPVAPEELRGVGLVDRVAFLDETIAGIGEGPVVQAEEYRGVDPESVGFAPVARFALVYGSGNVVMGQSDSTSRSPMLASDDVSKALEDAAKDPEIAAIIFRVDSPGGSPLAADIVWRAAARAKESGKPLIASVSNVAASGGYYVLAGADEILASPASLVGSIGVFAVRPVFGGLLDKLGIGYESMTRGRYADMLVSTKPLSEGARERLRAELDVIYDTFVGRVAGGRGLSRDQVDEVGRGRVWTGSEAVDIGLVDALGGLRAAVRRAKERAGIDAQADVALVPYPEPRSLVQQLDEAFQQAAVSAVPRLPALVQDLDALLGAWSPDEPLALAPFQVRIR